MSDRPYQRPEKQDTRKPVILSFEGVNLADLQKVAERRDTASDALPRLHVERGDALLLVAHLQDKSVKELIAEFTEIDKKAKAAFEKRDGQDWATAAKYYGKEVEILDQILKQAPGDATVKSALMRALRRQAASAAHLSTAKEVPDFNEEPNKDDKHPFAKTAKRDKEIRGELRDAAEESFKRLWDLLKDEKGRDGDKATVLLEWGENDLFRAKAKDGEAKPKDAQEIFAAAEKKFKDSLKLHLTLPEDKQVGDYKVRTLSLLATAEIRQGKWEEGWKHQAEAIKVLQEMAKLDDDTLFKKEDLKRPELGRKLATLQYELAMSKSMQEKPAIEEFDACLKTMKDYGVMPVGDIGGELVPIADVAEVMRQKGANYIVGMGDKPDYAKAREAFDQGLAFLRDIKDPKPEDLRRQALFLSDRSICFMATSKPEEAVQDLKEAQALEKKSGANEQSLMTLGRLISALQLRGKEGDVEAAKATYREFLSELKKQDPKAFDRVVLDYVKDHPELKGKKAEEIIRSIAETDLPKPPFKKE